MAGGTIGGGNGGGGSGTAGCTIGEGSYDPVVFVEVSPHGIASTETEIRSYQAKEQFTLRAELDKNKNAGGTATGY